MKIVTHIRNMIEVTQEEFKQFFKGRWFTTHGNFFGGKNFVINRHFVGRKSKDGKTFELKFKQIELGSKIYNIIKI